MGGLRAQEDGQLFLGQQFFFLLRYFSPTATVGDRCYLSETFMSFATCHWRSEGMQLSSRNGYRNLIGGFNTVMFGCGKPGFSLVNLSFGAFFLNLHFCCFSISKKSAGTLTGSPSGYPASPEKNGRMGAMNGIFPTLDSGWCQSTVMFMGWVIQSPAGSTFQL